MSRILSLAIAAALAGQAHAATKPAAASALPRIDTTTTTQLPRTTVPLHYTVEVTPHAQDMNFDGVVSIDLAVVNPTKTITLNAIDMAFSQTSLKGAGGALTPQVSIDAANQTATFTFDKELKPGRYVLSTHYTGKIGTQAVGIFALDYDTKDGKKRALYTQFENSDARRFIPSWDEPNYKAVFDLSAVVPKDQMAVSNMPVKSSADAGNGMKRVTFGTSPKMSTYLLFFGLGDFDRRTTKAAGGTEIGVIAQKGMVSQADFALESGAKIINEYNDYFGVKYPLPKLDNIAAPGQSQFFSAMENWGAIFTFEYALLLDPKVSTEGNKIGVFTTDAHEMAHQWFGDLVTMRWWDDLWLNEGFASWMEGRTTAKLHPEWETAINMVFVREGAMGRDSVATTHPVVQHVETVEQASQAFDTITYSKGESVIHMLENYLGENAWRAGVRRYIKKHAYSNTVSDDFWNAMDEGSKMPIKDIAHDFTLQPGIPQIDVGSATCSNGKTTVQLTQGEFTRDRPDKTPLRWRVPVLAQVVGHPDSRTLVRDGKGSITLQGCGPVLVNAGQAGYYRTHYSADQFAAISKAFAQLKPIDQLGLMSDTWSLGTAGRQPIADYLELTRSINADSKPQVQQSFVGSLATINAYKKNDANRGAFQSYAVKRLRPMLDKLGWEQQASDSAAVKALRMTLIGTLGDMGDAATLAEARKRFATLQAGGAMTPEMRRTVLGMVGAKATPAEWDQLHAMAKSAPTPMVKSQMYSLLAGAEDQALTQKALDLALTDEPGATVSAGMIRGAAFDHPDMVFDWAMAHRGQIDKLVDASSLSRYYAGLGSSSFDPAMIGKIRAYAEKYLAPTSRRESETAIANIEYRIKVRREQLPAIDAWLAKNGG
ncbi:M1 family metallopeptidase [Solilutibacter silvestris]|uniref:Aminopeptidase n=1 Tax=Solilutibacter silvestris TaxID=1645665 RepID=A0A2K1Q3U9_9GAMM|nr:M1 family metallopeptidase [Lysobacter silvestris]PNS09693.1 Aminopeptidase N [Lysobacter silvestris]